MRVAIASIFAVIVGFASIFALERAEAVVIATDARFAEEGARARFVLELTRPVDFSIFFLSDPYRVVIDLPEVAFRLPKREHSETAKRLVANWRYGQIAPGRSRVVLDLNEPATVENARVVDAAVSSRLARLVLDLSITDRETFLRSVGHADATGPRTAPADASSPNRGAQARTPLPTGGSSAWARPLIVLDAGHGGIDSGAVGRGGALEKDVVLEFTRLLREKLRETGRYDVAMTRDDDVFLSLRERVAVARDKQANLFISIHADSIRRSREIVRGASVYTLSERASDAVAAALAERENRADLIAGVDLADEPDEVTDILFDLARRETKNFSNFFARLLVEELDSTVNLIKNPRRSAGFRVLMAHDVPSVLVELGYLSNRHDEKLLTSSAWRARMANAIVTAIDGFFVPNARQARTKAVAVPTIP